MNSLFHPYIEKWEINVKPWWSFSVSLACFFLLSVLLWLDVDVQRAASSHKSRPIIFHFYEHQSKKRCQYSGKNAQHTTPELSVGVPASLPASDPGYGHGMQISLEPSRGLQLFIWEYNRIINHWNQVISIPPYQYHFFVLVENKYSVNNVCGFYEVNFCAAAEWKNTTNEHNVPHVLKLSWCWTWGIITFEHIFKLWHLGEAQGCSPHSVYYLLWLLS